ncbi:MAG TPA: diguanylate cyclase [Acidimicrobiia bacterium]|nr:diguanylate cyclase [Acidimicrobiia bacterium]
MIVDGDATARAATASVLVGSGLDVVVEASTGEEALQRARVMSPTVAVIDVSLPGMGAVTAARRLRDLSPHRLEIVAIASFGDVARLGEMVSTGTAAYVVKGKPADLIGAIRAVASGSGLLSAEASRPVLEEISRLYERERERNEELEQSVTQLQALSVTDWLTGLKNHGYFFDRLGEELERARRYDRPLAVVMADIDDFKAINDNYGHSTGDAVLRGMGEAFRRQIREVDIACRVGGEEFGIIMPETDAEGAIQAAERIRLAVADQPMPGVGRVTISLGVSVFPHDAQSAKDIVEASDRALYSAKRAGKNCTKLAGGAPAFAGSGRALASITPVVGTLLAALRMRAPWLADHSVRVAELATQIGTILELRVFELERLRLTGLLHDVGMLAVPDSVLLKTDPLTPADWATIRSHATNGFQLIADAVHEDVADGVLCHHEQLDGEGYPRKLSGDDIPLFARIVLVADAYDAMVSERPHRPPLTSDEALSELRANAGGRFDPEAVRAMIEVDRQMNTTATVLEFPGKTG